MEAEVGRNLCEFRARLVYKARPARAKKGKPVSKQNTF